MSAVECVIKTGSWSKNPLVRDDLMDAWTSSIISCGKMKMYSDGEILATMEAFVDHLSGGVREIVKKEAK